MTYKEQLKSPFWQKKRLDILNRDKFTCQLCGDNSTTLHVHHKQYIKGREVWDYEDENFVTYCANCHALIEHLKSMSFEVITLSKIPYGSSCYYTALAYYEEEKNPFIVFMRQNSQQNSVDIFSTITEDNLKGFLELINYGKLLIKNG